MKAIGNIEVERAVLPISLKIGSFTIDDPAVYPVKVQVHYLTETEATQLNLVWEFPMGSFEVASPFQDLRTLRTICTLSWMAAKKQFVPSMSWGVMALIAGLVARSVTEWKAKQQTLCTCLFILVTADH